MSGAKEIRSKISSIKKTRKITRAMEMVAASKMRRTQEKMQASRPYAEKIWRVVRHLAKCQPEYRHPLLVNREIKRVGLIVVSTDRGLCGALNTHLFKRITEFSAAQQSQGVKCLYSVFGKKGGLFLKRVGGEVLSLVENLGDKPCLADVVGVVKVMLDAFNDKTIDAIHIAYNRFENTVTQKTEIHQLIPLPQPSDEAASEHHYWDYLYEPDAKQLLEELLMRFVEVQVYQALVENIACEQAAKMVAMKNASENAGELIKQFQLAYNKARQSAITQELSEIVGGSEAL